MMQELVSRCVVFTLTLVATQSNTRIDSDSILTFLLHCALASGHKKNSLKIESFSHFARSMQHNATQALVSSSELGLSHSTVKNTYMYDILSNLIPSPFS